MVEEPPPKLRILLNQHAHGCHWHDHKVCGADGPHVNPEWQCQDCLWAGDGRWRLDDIGKDIASIAIRLDGDGGTGDKKHQV